MLSPTILFSDQPATHQQSRLRNLPTSSLQIAMTQGPKCNNLVLDAGPLLSLSPLRGLSETFFTVPQVLAELRDNRAREHFKKLGLLSGVKVEVRTPDAASLSHVIQWAKKTGDYSVLSHADLCVLALTYALDQEDQHGEGHANTNRTTDLSGVENSEPRPHSASLAVEDLVDQLHQTGLDSPVASGDLEDEARENDPNFVREIQESQQEPIDVELTQVQDDEPCPSRATLLNQDPSLKAIYDDPSDEDDGEGHWITPSNVALYKSRALDLLPDDGANGKNGKKIEQIGSGCMTADFAMQNVLLQMGLNLVGLEGRRIQKIKSWILRCHACFKICKDNSKKFCPSCGSPTLLRTSVTVAAPGASPNAEPMQIHLKRNFQYKLRGTKYPIPAPKPGSAKTGSQIGLILREDQFEYTRAKKKADGKREREEQRLLKGILNRELDSEGGRGVSSWMDPDWVPEMLSVGAGGKGRTMKSSRLDGDMPQIGYGRKNPNERRRKK